MSTFHHHSNFAELSRSECEELLGQRSVGRVGWNAAEGPQILPVNYAWHAGSVVFRTSPHGPLAGLARRTPVAFEIDDIDEVAGHGWSVLVLGSSGGVTQDYALTALWREGPVPWAQGTRNLFIAIDPRRITGRTVQAA